MVSDTNSPEQSKPIEDLTPLDAYVRAAQDERLRAEITLRNALLKLERAEALDERFYADERGRFYTDDLALARTVGHERVPILSYGPRDLISEEVLERYPFIGSALSMSGGRLESITFEEERLVLGIPILDQDTYIDARCYLDERGVILTTKRAAYRTRTGERETITTVRHGLGLEAIHDYLIAQGTSNHLVDEALTLIERRREVQPE